MKTINKLLGVCAMVLLAMIANPGRSSAQPGVSVSFQTFYDELQPYGTWVDDPEYGNVWVPDADEDFRPYASRGHWVVTPYGNTWVSDYEWGWAPFHYGRWRFDDYYGWEWIPGSHWGPAWVNWRTGGGYYAWAPLGPGISIDISFGGGYRIPNEYWVCVPQQRICDPYINRYYIPRPRVVNVINQTTIINNTYVNNSVKYVTGPRPHEIERYTHNRVQVYNINNAPNPHATIIQNNTVNIYRPTVINNHNDNNRPRPATVVNAVAYRNANPDAGIANRARGAAINHDNAVRLSQTARNPRPDNSNIVRVNQPVNTAPNGRPAQNNIPANGAGNQPANPANGQARPNRGNQQPQNNGQQPVNQPTQQPANQGTPQGRPQRQPQTAQPQQGNQPQAQPATQQANPQWQQRRQRPQGAQPQSQPAGQPLRQADIQRQQQAAAAQQAAQQRQQAEQQRQQAEQQRQQQRQQPQAPRTQPQQAPQRQAPQQRPQERRPVRTEEAKPQTR